MSARLSARSTAKHNAENRLVRQREKEDAYRTRWGNQVEYYKTWEKRNNLYEEWTSPRYYESNTRTIEANRKKIQHENNLDKRREKLRTLITEEKRSHEIEMMVKNRHCYDKPTISTEMLKDINIGLKTAQEDRQRYEAEIALYHQWRNNNPILRQHERAITTKNLKLNWLDQQVEKRMEKEKAEEESRQILAERNKRLQDDNAREEQLQRETHERSKQLQADLEKQMQELRLKQTKSEELRHDENDHTIKLNRLSDLLDSQEEIKRRILQRECALENVKLHKLKLRQKAIDVHNNLEQERDFVRKLIEADIIEKLADEKKKHEIQKTMNEFLRYTHDQQELERKRQQHFNFIFDSEAKAAYERQHEIWLNEQNARQALLHNILEDIKQQLENKAKFNKEKQRELLEERHSLLKAVEKYDEDFQRIKFEEEKKRDKWKQDIAKQVKEKKALEKEAKSKEEKRIDWELDAARKEEERLRKEIARLQQKCGPIRPTRSRIFL